MNKTRLLFPLLLAVSASCASKESAENTTTNSVEFSYEVDTVMVDAGDHFFFLNWSLSLSDITKDQKYLYNLNPQTFLLEIADLDDLKLERTVQLEKEGPNGVGNDYYQKIQVLENGNICLFGQYRINIVSPEGKLVNSTEFDQIALEEDERIGNNSVFSADGKLFASTLVNEEYKKPAKGIVVIDLDTDSINYVPMNLFQELKQFEIIHQVGNAPGIYSAESTYLRFIDDNLIISSSAYNEVYDYDTDSGSLSHFSFKATLTDNEKTQNFSNEVSSNKEWTEAEKAKNEQVSFQEFFKLPEQNIFWRVSRDKDRMIGDSTVFKYVATLFDQEFNMLKESELKSYHNSRKTFIKDGMLYTFLNIDDELAFVRIKPTISYE